MTTRGQLSQRSWAPFLAALALGCTSVTDRPRSRLLATSTGESPRPKPVVSAAEPRASAAEPRASAAVAPEAVPPFFPRLEDRARALASAPPALRDIALPPELAQLDYDGYRKLRFRPEYSLWRGEPGRFEVQFFPPGPFFREAVSVSVLDGDTPRRVPFASEWFSYEGLAAPPNPEGLEFTGLRVHAPINRPDYRDEVVAFHGASYFRAVGRGEVYGLSARGLAIDLGEPRPEEFPRFSELYLVRPGAEAGALWILALLESPRATGAYAFRVEPGDTTRIDVTARVFLRSSVSVLGLAPLTSMFLFGEDSPRQLRDFRPEVHDSDGLSSWSSSGEWLFRPLDNPPRPRTQTFRLDSPRGFGLVQRDRAFDHYQDLEARYQDRPSVWVEPLSGFGSGSLRLLEIAARSEATDNIALAWVPDRVEGDGLGFRYRLHVGAEDPSRAPAARVLATRIGQTDRGMRFLVDFAGPDLARSQAVRAVVSSTGGRVLEQHVEKNAFAEGLRASFEVQADSQPSDVQLRAFLQAGDDVLTETWSYLWQN
jgi:glucans biosynthesis protein